jgi:predicted transcriptional regulator
MSKDYTDYSWILRGKQRAKVLKVMDKPLIPTQIKDKTNLGLNNVSDILREFRKRKVARCLNPKEKTGRIYELTDKGKKLKKQLSN